MIESSPTSTDACRPWRELRMIGGGVALSRSSSATPVRLIHGGSPDAPLTLESPLLGGSVGPVSDVGVGDGAVVDDRRKNFANLF